MSAEGPTRAGRISETPRVEAGKPALRVCHELWTVDIVSARDKLLAVIGDGVGSQPATAEITPATVAIFLELAETIDERTAWDTGAWPLAC